MSLFFLGADIIVVPLHPPCTRPSYRQGSSDQCWQCYMFACVLHKCHETWLASVQFQCGITQIITGHGHASAKRQNSFRFLLVLSVFPVPGNLERELSRKITIFCKVQIRVVLNDARPCHQVSTKRDIGSQVLMFPCFLRFFTVFSSFLG